MLVVCGVLAPMIAACMPLGSRALLRAVVLAVAIFHVSEMLCMSVLLVAVLYSHGVPFVNRRSCLTLHL